MARLRAAILLAGAVGIGCGVPSPESRPPNVLLIVIDTLRADHLGVYGHPRATTPCLDALAAQGAVMEVAIAPSSWSPPSHTTIVTGLEPQNHRVLEWGHGIAAEAMPLAAQLKQHGYSTALFSSHRSLARGVGRFAEGFDSTVVMNNEQDAKVLRHAAAWIREAKEPYFLQIVLMTPHAPYTKYPSRYDDGLFPETPAGGDREFPFVESAFVGEGGIPTSVALDSRQDAGYYLNRYDRSIRHVDRHLSRFLNSIGRRASDPDADTSPTLLVVASDHGESFGERGSFSHELYLYDHLVRVPLLFHYPGRITAGQVWGEPVGLIDIVPTVLAFAGAAPAGTQSLGTQSAGTSSPTTDGADLSALLADGVLPDTERPFHGSYVTGNYQRFMVRRDGYKLIWDARSSTAELYDLVLDPGEQTDLLADTSDASDDGFAQTSQAVFESLHGDLATQLAEYAAAMPELTRIRITEDVREELRALGYVD